MASSDKRPHSLEPMAVVRKMLFRILVLAIWILVWAAISYGVGQELLVPSPFKVFVRIVQLIQTGAFWQTTAVTVARITIGFAVGAAAGVLFAVLTSISPVVHIFFKPILSIVKATPVVSFIVLALVWIKGGQIPSFISFLMVFPIVWGNVMKGIGQTDRQLLEMAKVYHVSKAGILKKIYVNSVLPYFVPAVMTSMGLAWKAGIAAEVLSLPQFAIGTAIYNAKIYLETIDLFAWSIVVIIISVLLEKIVVTLIHKMLPGDPAMKAQGRRHSDEN